MKTIIQSLITALLIISLSHTGIAQTNKAALEYMNKLDQPTRKIKTSTWTYLRAVAKSKNPKRIEKQREKLLNSIQKAHKEIEQLAIPDDTTLRDGMLSYLDLQYKVVNEDYAAIVDMEEIAEQSYDAMEAYIIAQEEASKKLDVASDELRTIQEEYCKKNKILLVSEEDEMSKKIKRASAALSYYNDMFLLTFKPNIEEGYIIDALDRNDINALQQSINALADFSEEGLDQLEEMDAYMGDTKLKVATRKQLKYYQDASNKSYPKLVDFYLNLEDYEKITKNFEKIKPKKRTQQDVDTFNKAVDTYNKSIDEFNSVNQKLNTEREKLYNNWEKIRESFFVKHVD